MGTWLGHRCLLAACWLVLVSGWWGPATAHRAQTGNTAGELLDVSVPIATHATTSIRVELFAIPPGLLDQEFPVDTSGVLLVRTGSVSVTAGVTTEVGRRDGEATHRFESVATGLQVDLEKDALVVFPPGATMYAFNAGTEVASIMQVLLGADTSAQPPPPPGGNDGLPPPLPDDPNFDPNAPPPSGNETPASIMPGGPGQPPPPPGDGEWPPDAPNDLPPPPELPPTDGSVPMTSLLEGPIGGLTNTSVQVRLVHDIFNPGQADQFAVDDPLGVAVLGGEITILAEAGTVLVPNNVASGPSSDAPMPPGLEPSNAQLPPGAAYASLPLAPGSEMWLVGGQGYIQQAESVTTLRQAGDTPADLLFVAVAQR
jgi:hypothetical protein